MTKQITQTDLEKEYKKVSGVKSIESDVDRRGVIMLACCIHGPKFYILSKYLNYSHLEIKECLKRLKSCHIIQNGKMAVEWFEKNGGIAFCCDHLVVEGLLTRKVGYKHVSKQ